jgi:hypothetical protein
MVTAVRSVCLSGGRGPDALLARALSHGMGPAEDAPEVLTAGG